MAKKVTGYVKLQIEAGKATPAPPVGTALGPQGVNIMDFCKAFNAKTAKDAGLIIPVVVTVYSDRSYSFITKTPPAAVLLKKAAKLEKGSGVPNKTKVGKVTKKQVEEIAKLKLVDLNTVDLAAAVRSVEGTARSMGIEVVGWRRDPEAEASRAGLLPACGLTVPGMPPGASHRRTRGARPTPEYKHHEVQEINRGSRESRQGEAIR